MFIIPSLNSSTSDCDDLVYIISSTLRQTNHWSLLHYLFLYNMGSISFHSNPCYKKQWSILLYHALGVCFKPYRAFFNLLTLYSLPFTIILLDDQQTSLPVAFHLKTQILHQVEISAIFFVQLMKEKPKLLYQFLIVGENQSSKSTTCTCV